MCGKPVVLKAALVHAHQAQALSQKSAAQACKDMVLKYPAIPMQLGGRHFLKSAVSLKQCFTITWLGSSLHQLGAHISNSILVPAGVPAQRNAVHLPLCTAHDAGESLAGCSCTAEDVRALAGCSCTAEDVRALAGCSCTAEDVCALAGCSCTAEPVHALQHWRLHKVHGSLDCTKDSSI